MDQHHHSTCPLDCPDTCALEVTTRDDRVLAIRGRADANAVTGSFICSKVAKFTRRQQHATRLTQPLRRVGAKGSGAFEAISWKAAITEIADQFRRVSNRYGSESLVPFHYGGSNGLLSDDFLDALFFARLGASQLAKTICAVPTTQVASQMYGKMPGVAFQDFVNARTIVIWGANPKASNTHLVPFLKQAKRRGAFIAVVDPINHFSAAEIDLHLPVRPGSDAPLALGLIKLLRDRQELDRSFMERWCQGVDELFAAADTWDLAHVERVTGVPQSSVVTLADRLAHDRPGLVRCGWGLERNLQGPQAVAAVLAIPAVLGLFSTRGGGYTLSNSGMAAMDLDTALGQPLNWNTRSLNMSQMGRWLNGGVDPAVHGLFVYNANPVATVPDQNAVIRGLCRDDLFTVVHDQVMTDTAAFADLVLPATTFLEHWDVRKSYGNYVIGGVRPVVPAFGESRSNLEVFRSLAQAMGFTDEAFGWSDRECIQAVARGLHINSDEPLDLARILDGDQHQVTFAGDAPVQFETVFPQTGNGKINLMPPCLGARGYAVDDGPAGHPYPLQLISPATSKLISSTLGEFHLNELDVRVHPSEGLKRDLEQGMEVRVFNELGEVVCPLRLDDRVRPGVAVIPKGAWRLASRNGSTSTALCPDHVGDLLGQACFNDARVDIQASSS